MKIIFGIIFTIIISIVLPLTLFIYALYKRLAIPFILGSLAFFISQIVLRIPLINYLNENVLGFTMLSVTQPIIYILVIGFSASIFEEVARYMMMRLFMKKRKWHAGFFFGAGHGGIEAIIFVGLQAVTIFFTSTVISGEFFIGGIERFFAILLHIGLSIIVLKGIVKKQIRYLFIAIFIHGMIDSFIGFAPMLFPPQYQLLAIEGLLIIVSVSIIIYTIYIKRKGVL